MKRLFASVGIVGLVIGVAVGGPPVAPASAPAAPAAEPTPTPSELVARLGSQEYREREAAVAALERAGAAALPALRAAVKSSDPEVRQRASALLLKAQRAADSADKLAPKKIALNYKDTPLGTALNDLKARTGLNIVIDTNRIADPLRKVTCVTGEVPVWEALERFCVAAGLREAFTNELEVPKVQVSGRRAYTPPAQIPTPDAVPLVLIDGKGPSVAGSRNTAVRVLALPPSFPGHRVTLGNGETTLCFDVAPAPGLNWQEVVGVRITKLIDDAGRIGSAGSPRAATLDTFDFDNVIAFGGPGVRFGGGFGGRFDPRTGAPLYPDTMPNPRITPVPLKIATPDSRKLKRLEGVILGEITLTNQTLLTMNEPEKYVGATLDGPGRVRLTVVAAEAGKGAAGPTLQVNLSSPSPWSVSARRGWNPGGIWPEAPRAGNQTPTLQVFDAGGKQIHAQRTTPGAVADLADFDGMTMTQNLTMQFAKGASLPAKLVVVGPRPMIVEVPFAMENVPLP
jgi:hypothetical protein